MPTAEILTIGTEILLGEIQDTNTAYLARTMKDMGIDLYRTQTVGDNSARIASTIRDILSRADILITTGGLGPTVDDPTRQSVADALGVPLVFREDCWDQIQGYFQRLNRPIPENNRRQAYLPAGASPIVNPVGTAPGFIVDSGGKTIISVPGVPKEMEYLMTHTVVPYLQQRWEIRTAIRTRVIHTAGMGEAVLDGIVGEYETWQNPTVGLLAKAGLVDIRVGAKAESIAEADRMVDDLISKIVPKLGRHVFGYDQTTLAEAVLLLVREYGRPVSLRATGFAGLLKTQFSQQTSSNLIVQDPYQSKRFTTQPLYETSPDELTMDVELLNDVHPAELSIQIHRAIDDMVTDTRKFGGPPSMAPAWAVNTTLDMLRQTMMDILSQKG
jgi:nicotinamide-nucleotide amidase